MKNFVIIYKATGNNFLKKFSNSKMSLIGSFLLFDANRIDNWITWFHSDSYDATESNYCWIEKENDIVIIGYLHSDDMEPHIEVPFTFLMKVLALWKECREGKKDELTIEEENGVFNVF